MTVYNRLTIIGMLTIIGLLTIIGRLTIIGLLGTAETDFSPQIKALSEHYTVIAFDPRGYGKSRAEKRSFPTDFYHRDAMDAAGLILTS